MAGGIQKVGEAGLEMTLDFPDAKMREDFEIAFRGWAKQWKQAATTHRLTLALAQGGATEEGGDTVAGDEGDTGGFLYTRMVFKKDGTGSYEYVDLIPLI